MEILGQFIIEHVRSGIGYTVESTNTGINILSLAQGVHWDFYEYISCGYLDGKKHGSRRWYFNDGRVLIEDNYLNNERHGPQHEWYQNGNRFRENNFSHGRMYGWQRIWNPDGQLYKEEYLDYHLDNKYVTTVIMFSIPIIIFIANYLKK